MCSERCTLVGDLVETGVTLGHLKGSCLRVGGADQVGGQDAVERRNVAGDVGDRVGIEGLRVESGRATGLLDRSHPMGDVDLGGGVGALERGQLLLSGDRAGRCCCELVLRVRQPLGGPVGSVPEIGQLLAQCISSRPCGVEVR